MSHSSLFDLRDKVAIITGSSRGLGLASAKGMAEHGARVVISGRKADACEAAAAEIRAMGGQAIAVPCNISRKEEVQNLVDSAVKEWGRVDIVMANAAIHPWIGSVLDLQEETFNKFMQVNVQSSIWLAQMTVPGMVERGYGRFIVVASIVGLLGDSMTGTYGLTKAADMQLVRNLANEFASKGVTANCIAPGTFKTEMARSQWEDPAMVEWYRARNPSQRFGEVEEIAGLAVMLASPSGGYINGQTIAADGGHTISFR
ncbi:SDR family NAD(P)-dependent oxidoreductase [Pseudomonas sp. NFACC07-1]|uniref:SDR family NAD(P)-dependent oxidoreductase n=1 Tax=Pseudomonas sp. NFACC07-1 TaxID=1566239 RepID=UPI0008D8B527|nr:SDR family oxidoreductase [Pseudomonas sp. NFACC07-1]SEI51697.1 NAD(P)-dependent dehydrogenase, short-chain alcohol dehydrogenase family [Pseudomonas sp. NFACC07-1]